jgi:hypothetical protein
VDAALSVGPVFARHLGHRLYRGEYFAIQSDAHVDYVLGWDVDIINQWRSAKNEMAILTAYLSGIEDHMNITTGERTSSSRPIMCMSDFEGGEGGRHLRHGQQPEGVPYSKISYFVCVCVCFKLSLCHDKRNACSNSNYSTHYNDPHTGI